uniref:Uncharacterized protein n=1 Tax=Ditylenchus dipsaci TaxID=166011 RepID=A0A915DE09_9BILA
MSDILGAIKLHPKRALLFAVAVGGSAVTLQTLWRYFFSGRQKLPRIANKWKISDKCEIDVSAFNSAIDSLEIVLNELEPHKFKSDVSRGDMT